MAEVVLNAWGEVETYCDVCGRRDSWGCGHSGSARWAARRHKATRKHRIGACECTRFSRYGLSPAERDALSEADREAADRVQAARGTELFKINW